MPEPIEFEMGLTHAEFYRTLPSALQAIPYRQSTDRVIIEYAGGTITILLKPQRQRHIALLSVPYTPVSFAFDNLTETQTSAFMGEFMRYYQRGGG